jgi:hypothetical protein
MYSDYEHFRRLNALQSSWKGLFVDALNGLFQDEGKIKYEIEAKDDHIYRYMHEY